MKTNKISAFLILLLTTAFLTGCPIDDDDDLFSGTIRVTNADATDTITNVAIPDDCTVTWGAGTAVSIPPGGSQDFSVGGDDTWDIRACFDDATCDSDFFRYVGIGETITSSHTSGGPNLPNC